MKIIQEYQKCIGCGSCVELCPKYWKMGEQGKAELIGGKIRQDGKYELILEETGCNQKAAEICPVQCIYVEN